MTPADEQIPPFFVALQELAREHGVIAYVAVGVVMRDGKAVIATAGGSKLIDGEKSTASIYESMGKAFDQIIQQLIETEPVPADRRNLN